MSHVKEENRLRWGARTSNPARGAKRAWWVRLPLSSAMFMAPVLCLAGG